MNHSQALEFQISLSAYVKSAGARNYMLKFFNGRQPEAVAALSTEFGETFYWSAETSSIVEAGRKSIPEWGLAPETLPAYFGFMVFDHEFMLPNIYDRTGEAIAERVCAIGWVIVTKDGDGEFVAMPFGNPQITADDEVSFMTFGYIAGSQQVLPTAVHRWKFGETWYETAKREGGDLPTEYRLERTRLIAASLAFLNQPFISSAQQRADRATSRRLAKGKWAHEPLIRVVQLRRSSTRSGAKDGSREPGEWTCQWVVSGHWRQQFYPSTGENRPIWILPYVKGPEDKPLKPPRAKVFAVVR